MKLKRYDYDIFKLKIINFGVDKMLNEEKNLRIIIYANKIHNHYLYDEFDEVDEYINKINELLDEDIKKDISYLKNIDIFTETKHFNDNFKNNHIRKYIVDNINNVDRKDLLFSFELIKKYIAEDYQIIKYCENLDDSKIIELGIINPNILFMIDNIKEDTLINILRKNKIASLVLDGNILLTKDGKEKDKDGFYHYSYIIKNKDKFLNNKDIYNLYVEGLKRYLKEDIIEYVYLSDKTKENVDIAKFVINIEPKLRAYVSDLIKDNI